MSRKKKTLDTVINEALALEAEDARDAGRLGYMARALVQATMPHRHVKGAEFTRQNGAFTLSMLAPSQTGLPYGSVPRLLVAWVTTEAVRTRERELMLGDSLSDFMRQLGLVPTGGRWGSITRLKDQMARLFGTTITCLYQDNQWRGMKSVQVATHYRIMGDKPPEHAKVSFPFADNAMVWWDPLQPRQATLWKSTVTLSHEFFEELISSPVPVDMGALKVLKQSPMALDIYCWLTYRMSYLGKKTLVPWEALAMQFGADYAADAQGLRDFKKNFLKQLAKVHVLYPEADVAETDHGLSLKPSPPHVLPRPCG